MRPMAVVAKGKNRRIGSHVAGPPMSEASALTTVANGVPVVSPPLRPNTASDRIGAWGPITQSRR